MSLTSEVEAIIRPVVEGADAFLIDVVMRGSQGNHILEVFVDTKDGVRTNQCAAISRAISTELDRLDVVKGRYELVVSSPGLDRPIRFAYQYPRHVGRTLRLTVPEEGGRTILEGKLVEAAGEHIILEFSKGVTREINLADIIECIVSTPW